MAEGLLCKVIVNPCVFHTTRPFVSKAALLQISLVSYMLGYQSYMCVLQSEFNLFPKSVLSRFPLYLQEVLNR